VLTLSVPVTVLGGTAWCAPGQGEEGSSSARGFAERREPDTGTAEEVPSSHNPPKDSGTVIPVYFHVISAGASKAEGNISDAQIDRQIRVLNRSFGGGYGGFQTPFSFELVGVTRTINVDWFNMGYQSQAERRAKEALRQGGADALNIYSTAGGGFLGWATFPSRYKAQPFMDGIVVHYGSLPGGFIDRFDLGYTATHEAGHWFGLYHTFQNGCSNNGDYVDDTAPQRVPTGGCPEGKDTCTEPGLDPIHNYMDYSDDDCYTEFTQGQSERMVDHFTFYRAGP
jgi:hypothetical protein